jgi:hypothetical protein
LFSIPFQAALGLLFQTTMAAASNTEEVDLDGSRPLKYLDHDARDMDTLKPSSA